MIGGQKRPRSVDFIRAKEIPETRQARSGDEEHQTGTRERNKCPTKPARNAGLYATEFSYCYS